MLEMLRLALVSDQIRDKLESASSSATQLMKIINAVLDLGRVEKGELELRREPFALQGLVNECLAPFERDAAGRDLQLRGVVEPGLPAMVQGDILRLRQVLVSLLANALKFTEAGFVELRVQPAGRDAANGIRVRFSVVDTGSGLEQQQIAALFRAFRTGSVATTPGKQRAGLGLLLSSRVIAAMGSSLQIESDPGRGSTFRFEMLFAETGMEEATALSAVRIPDSVASAGDLFSVPADGSDGGYRRLNIMVIDHDPANRLVMEHMLHNFQINPLILHNGRQALSRLSMQRWDMVFMNLNTPDKDGHESLQAIRDNPRYKRLPIVAIATQAMDKQYLLETGMTDVLLKPVRRADLESCIRSWVRG
jgi:CheY-like chemotaxis protein